MHEAVIIGEPATAEETARRIQRLEQNLGEIAAGAGDGAEWAAVIASASRAMAVSSSTAVRQT